jgi:plastocyanin
MTRLNEHHHETRRTWLLLCLTWVGAAGLWVIASGVLTGAPLSLAESTAAATAITVDNFSFSPATITVPVGSTITWTNRDDVPHKIVATNHEFKSPVLDTDQQYSQPFAKAGRFDYFCSLHPKMTGTVIVK